MPQSGVSDSPKRNPNKSSQSNKVVEKLLNDNDLQKKGSVPKFEDNEKLTELRVPITPKASPPKNQSSKNDSKYKLKNKGIDGETNRLASTNSTLKKPVNSAEKVGAGSSALDFPKNSFQVQLAAVRNKLAAQNEWKRLKMRHSEILGKLVSNIIRADLGTKGIYFRLRAGPLIDKGSATQLCGALRKVNVNCLVIRPGR